MQKLAHVLRNVFQQGSSNVDRFLHYERELVLQIDLMVFFYYFPQSGIHLKIKHTHTLHLEIICL